MLENTILPKWPGLLVIGKSITEEQAEEIIFRTSGANKLSIDY